MGGISDWIPKNGSDWGSLLLGGPLLYGAKKVLYDQPADAQKAGLDKASQMSSDSSAKLQQFWMDQQAKAQANYKPLQGMFASSYGTAGLQAPQLPAATNKPLKGMYGGG